MAKLYLEEYYSPFSKHNRETCFWYVTIVSNKAYVKLQGNYQSDGNEHVTQEVSFYRYHILLNTM